MEVINVDEKEKWNAIIMGFPKWDIYYLVEYAKSFQIHGDGNPILIYIEFDSCKMAYVMMENDISQCRQFAGHLPEGKYFDWTTPYGYGGPLFEGEITDQWMNKALEQIEEYAQNNHIVSQFFRCHPLLQNQKYMESVSQVVCLKKTVYIDTSTKDIILSNMTTNGRNMFRKAEKSGVRIISDTGERIKEFIDIYKMTMDNRRAEEYYYFDQQYFDYLKGNLYKNMIIFYALYEEKIISAAIFFYNERYMHYHLSGTLRQYNCFGATNMLLTEAAFWAAQKGIVQLHLGGGTDVEDSLLRFKKHFNRNGLIDFYIGCNIFLQDDFDRLVTIRKQTDHEFDDTKKFLIQYRG